MLTLSVKSVRVFESEKFSTVEIKFNETFDGFVAKRDELGRVLEGEFVETQIDTLNFPPSVLTGILTSLNDEVGLLRSVSEKRFGQAEFGAILFGAKISVDRKRVAKNETFKSGDEDIVAERDLYTTELVKLELSEKAKLLIDKMTMTRLGL